MKLQYFALSLATAGSIVAAQPHRHHHRHPEKRAVEIKTVVDYVLNGVHISEEECLQGIKNGSLVWAAGTISSVTPPPAPSSTQPAVGAQFYEKPTTTAAATPAAATTPAKSGSDYQSDGSTGVDADFPDGELDCSHFPSDYGAVPVPWENQGGWTGLQYVTYNYDGSAITDIATGVAGDTCKEGAMCSYACPPGYQKAQWPAAQGSTGQSVGGIECKGGKLHLTNPGLSKKLCIKGVGNVQIRNDLGKDVSVCRTDYPGTESETVPLKCSAGATVPVTNPDGNSYYKHQGAVTSAQYYLNPAGVPLEKACTWGKEGSNTGNWAPMNMGIGQKDGATWLALFPNAPTNPLTDACDYTIEITGDNLSGACKYQNGQFHTLTGTNSQGCTVQLMSGMATIIFS